MTENDALMILNAVPGIGNARIRKLLEHYGSALEVLSLSANELTASQSLPENILSQLAAFNKLEFLSQEKNLMEDKGVTLLTIKDAQYPKNLSEIPDAPHVLYVKGEIPQNCDESIAIVGSRRASCYGTSKASQFAMELAERQIAIVSGLARGIDTAAHKGALQAKGKTIAVLGCGFQFVYPSENKELLLNISNSGAVISEFPMQTPPIGINFPRRNRIISGLSRGVLIVEAALRSGALITADFALEQGREVYALPGNVDHLNAGGVNNLIKQGARLVSCVDEILEDLSVASLPQKSDKVASNTEEAAAVSSRNLNESQRNVFDRLSDRPLHLDEITHRCGNPVGQISAVLFQLEMKRKVRQMPGNLFKRTKEQVG